jgi:hypothetical protein
LIERGYKGGVWAGLEDAKEAGHGCSLLLRVRGRRQCSRDAEILDEPRSPDVRSGSKTDLSVRPANVFRLSNGP